MASTYYLNGYTPPEGVSSKADVRTLQKKLGVTADGVWGPKTQAAYERGGVGASGGMGLFESYYNSILGMVSVPSVSVNVPTRAELQSDFEASLRPNVDLAITNRKDAGEAEKAELDADAAARGMASSTYVSSMKEREQDDVQSDVALLEAQYTATLAERVQEALMQYEQMQLEASMFNAQMSMGANELALNAASDWYSAYLSSQKRSGRSSAKTDPLLTYDECRSYVAMLGADAPQVFNNSSEFWTERRLEIAQSVSDEQYSRLEGYANYLHGAETNASPKASKPRKISGGGSVK